ncbi:adenylate/guanylate cyclase domain-containing protein, partial [Paracraurococcus ruber]
PGGAARPPAEAAAPMVGRDREMARLRQALVATEPGEARIAAVIGAPGTGKSRLCQEFAAACRAEGLPVAAIRVQPYGTARPLQPMTEFLRSAWLGLEAEEAGPLSAARVEQALAAAGAADPVDAAVVCDFLGIPGRMALPAWLNPVARIARLVDIVTTLVRRRGAERSVILLEDLHWLDEASEGFVAALAAAVRDTRCLLVVNSRPGHDRPWMQPPRANRIALAELGEAETGALIASLVGPDPALAGLRARIAARSGGNPFFAEELVRALRGQGIIAGESGAFRRGEAEGQGVLPPNLQAVIGARIDSLAGTPRRVLQTAAVIGQTFRLPVLQAVAQLDRAALDVALAGLCEDGLLQRAPGMAEPDFQFRHPLIREVAYGMQLQARRAPLHAAVARAMERLDPARQEDAAALIAYHHEEGGEPRQAAVYAAHAARWLGPRSSAEATRFWHKVRGLLAGMPRAPESDRLRIEASGQIAWVGWREGLTPEQARPFVEEALGWAGETDDSVQPLLMLVAARITQVNGGSADTFVAEIRRAIALAAARGDAGRVATLQAALSHAYGWAGLLRQALEASDAALAGVGAVSDFDHRFLGYSLRHWALALRGRILVRLGRFEEGTACLDAIIAINELIDPTVQFIGHVGYVDLAWCTDDAAMAARHAAKIAALAARHGSSYLRAYSAAIEAIARGIAGNHDAAAEGIERSLGLLAESRAAIEFEPELLASLAEHRLRLADAAGAAAAARRAIGLAASRASRLPACRARITLAQALPASTEAATLLAEAEALIEETGATIFRPRWRLARRALDGRVSREGPGR